MAHNSHMLFPPNFGCFPNITLPPFGYKAYVLEEDWIQPMPALTKFTPGHDARKLSNESSIQITLEFNLEMSCSSVTESISLNMSSSGTGSTPTFGTASCTTINNATPPAEVYGVSVSTWSWSATLENIPDGILEITVNNPSTEDGTASTNVSCHRHISALHFTDVDVGDRPPLDSQGSR